MVCCNTVKLVQEEAAHVWRDHSIEILGLFSDLAAQNKNVTNLNDQDAWGLRACVSEDTSDSSFRPLFANVSMVVQSVNVTRRTR